MAEEKFTARSFVKQIVGFSLPTFVGAAISFISVPISTWLFSTEDYGAISLFLTYCSLIVTLCYFGFDQAYVRYFSEMKDDDDKSSLLLTCLMIGVVFAIISTIPILIFSSRIFTSSSFHESVFCAALLSLFVLATILNRYTTLNARLEMKVVSYSLQSILMVAATRLSYLCAALYGASSVTAVLLITINAMLIAIVFLIARRRNLKPIKLLDKAAFKKLCFFALPVMPAALLASINASATVLLVQTLFGEAQVGIYSTAITISGVVSLVQTGFSTYWYPFIYKNMHTIRDKVPSILRALVLLMTCGALLTLVFSDYIYLLLGKSFREGIALLPILLISPVANAICEVTGIGINISKKTYYTLFATTIALVLNITTCMAAAPICGLYSPAISSAVGGLTKLVLMTHWGNREYNTCRKWTDYGVGLLIICSASILFVVVLSDALLRRSLLLSLLFVCLCYYRADIKLAMKVLHMRKAE